MCMYACMYKEGDRGLRADMKVMAAKLEREIAGRFAEASGSIHNSKIRWA